MRQTAVEYLVEQLIPKAMVEYDSTTYNVIERAKEMEKSEKAKEYLRGYNDAKKFDKLIEDIQEH